MQSLHPNREGGFLETSWLNFITDWDIPPAVTATLVAVGLIYVRGWIALRRSRPSQIPVWRFFSFFVGLLSIFVAVSSSLDTYSESLLCMHMAQHFVLMSVAPPLIVLGSPFVPMLRGLPRPIVSHIGGPIFRSSLAHFIQEFVSRLPFAWLAMNLTYVGWHIPKAYEFALSSENWHNFEHFCFFATSLIYWWPIVQPWPARRRLNSWMLIPYLLTSDLVNTGLSAFLCFSGQLLYPSYGVVERPFGIDALKDQIAAGAFMWVFGSLVFLVPAIYLTARFLANGRLVSEKTELERTHALAQ
jgi:cytochrome c oxidase assembly factor CtaG